MHAQDGKNALIRSVSTPFAASNIDQSNTVANSLSRCLPYIKQRV